MRPKAMAAMMGRMTQDMTDTIERRGSLERIKSRLHRLECSKAAWTTLYNRHTLEEYLHACADHLVGVARAAEVNVIA
jgi:hypothetical protein